MGNKQNVSRVAYHTGQKNDLPQYKHHVVYGLLVGTQHQRTAATAALGSRHYIKRAHRKRLVHFLLREIKINVLVGEIRNWKVLDALRGVAVAWDSISAEVIRNYLTRCCFGQGKVATDEDAGVDEENDEWVELQTTH
ncbi:hypothetical protein PR048_003298 [Dryococelus australis]|uniref:DDE-1 domain-containing protein n=1 Tax=Dryococelus australis TaxID=614101 RepID=A0ABQ9IP55_9NEOP|nr:hypothetical protein PR048_003298 [Dryococelus australis]